MWHGKLHRTTKNIRSFLVSSKNQIFLLDSEKNGKGLEGEFCSYIVLYPSLRKSPVKKYATGNQHDPTSLFFNQHQTRYIKRVYQNHHKSFALMYRKIEIRFDIYGTEYFKSVIKGFKFVFNDFFPCILNFCFATQVT